MSDCVTPRVMYYVTALVHSGRPQLDVPHGLCFFLQMIDDDDTYNVAVMVRTRRHCTSFPGTHLVAP